MIQKAVRTISEKLTSIEDPIELTQKGKIAVKGATTFLAIPTTIENVFGVNIIPMNASGALAINGGSASGISPKKSGWYCDMVKYNANDVSAALLYTTVANQASVFTGHIAVKSNAIYEAVRNIGTAATATAGVGASNSMWKKVPYFSSNANAKNFLKVTLRGASYATTNVKFAYEVIGY